MNGHEKLVSDLKKLLKEAEDYQFHDFKNEKYPTPKIQLVLELGAISDKARTGKYDNLPNDLD